MLNNHGIFIFNVVSNNEELTQEFYDFFVRYGLVPLFNNEGKAGNIKVTDNDVRGVVNPAKKYHKLLLNFADILAIDNNEMRKEEAIFKIIYTARSFQKMMIIIEKILNQYTMTKEEHLFNFWNIVYYHKDLFN